MAAVLSACAPGGSVRLAAPATLSNDEIVALLNQRVGQDVDQDGQGAHGGRQPARELHFLVRWRVGAEEIACGYAGYPAPSHTGPVPPPLLDTIFIVRGRQLILDRDVDAAAFQRMQDQLCGPDWIEPFAPSVVA